MSQPKVLKESKFSLTPVEANYIKHLQMVYQQLNAGYLSTIATSRLAYEVTNATQFQFDVDKKELIIRELELPKQPPQPPKNDSTVKKAQ